jgi:hypothetical protein
MTQVTLVDLQASLCDTAAFNTLEDYFRLCKAFLELLTRTQPTRIISPTHSNYAFFQYGESYGYKITRPLNTSLFIEHVDNFQIAFERFVAFLADLKRYQGSVVQHERVNRYLETSEVNKVVYTLQQSIGCIGDSFENANQSRKRVGQLFEILIRLIIQEVGLECEPRTIRIPIPDYPSYELSYGLDLVLSLNKALRAAETPFLHETEIVVSVKTTSKDRLDRIFLDKYLLTKLLGRDVPVIAIFLHDVQRAKVGNSIFSVSSTFKSNHFLGYTVAIVPLDGVYYVDPRSEMRMDEKLREQIRDFQTFLVRDLWSLTSV